MKREDDLVLTMPEVLRLVNEELQNLETAMESLHPLVNVVASNSGSKDTDQLRAMQNIDHMEQILVGLAGFLRDLSRQASEHWKVDAGSAVANITLGDLAKRLRSEAAHDRSHPEGDVEMFG